MAELMIFDHMPDGTPVREVRLKSGALEADLLTLGVTLRALRFQGQNLTLGFDSAADYLTPGHSAGGICGPVANRIAGARASLDGTEYRFDDGPGGNTLHSGQAGTQLQAWQLDAPSEREARFSIDLAAGAGGFPGNRRIEAIYRLSDDTLALDLSATTDAPTWISLAQHAYWNLTGAPDYSGHELEINAEQYLPSVGSLPKAPEDVAGTDFDFRSPVVLDRHSVDHNFCLRGSGMRWAARLHAAGLSLEMCTDAPGLQVYDGHGLNQTPHGAFAGIALEAQHWPNALHNPEFPSIVLRPGETYTQSTTWRFYRS
ncbi:MAG: aldose epimerase family protein [Pseudomonadota bacterium]